MADADGQWGAVGKAGRAHRGTAAVRQRWQPARQAGEAQKAGPQGSGVPREGA